MHRKYLVIYDYYKVGSTGKEHFGINYILISFLEKQKFNFTVLKQEFNPGFYNILFIKLPSIYKSITSDNFTDIICYNNINALLISILKIILRRNFKVIFVSLDFSKKRFNNFILDNIYVFIDYIASKLSDQTWNCAYKIFEYRKKFLKKDKNFYIPNIPNYDKLGLKKFDTFTIVMTSFLHENYMFEEVFKLFDFIKEKNIRLFIIGEGELRKKITTQIKNKGVEKNVLLTGYLNHDEVIKILEQSHLGLALYSGKSDFNFWGDSLKIREYLYYELPVITTDVVYNHKEVINENLGLVIKKDSDLVKLVMEIYCNKDLYKKIVASIKVYNSSNSIDKLLKERLI